ncbi:MAG: glutathione binding-like protein, partial [Colwellia sp.]|nr:glutathione binding-like protein [Colwellia sp.]
ESRLTDEHWLVNNHFSIADITVGSCLISLLHANYQIDQIQWPKLYQYNERWLSLPIVQAQIAIEHEVFNNAAS